MTILPSSTTKLSAPSYTLRPGPLARQRRRSTRTSAVDRVASLAFLAAVSVSGCERSCVAGGRPHQRRIVQFVLSSWFRSGGELCGCQRGAGTKPPQVPRTIPQWEQATSARLDRLAAVSSFLDPHTGQMGFTVGHARAFCRQDLVEKRSLPGLHLIPQDHSGRITVHSLPMTHGPDLPALGLSLPD